MVSRHSNWWICDELAEAKDSAWLVNGLEHIDLNAREALNDLHVSSS